MHYIKGALCTEESEVLQMLDRISEVQMVHNRQKTAAMHELLEHGKGDQASTVGGTEL